MENKQISVLIIDKNDPQIYQTISGMYQEISHFRAGLISMKERAEFMGGSFHIYSVIGDGAELNAEFPL